MDKHKTHRFAQTSTDREEVIAEYMTTNIISLKGEASVHSAAQLMDEKHVGSLLVGENGNYTGIVTETDLTRRVISKGLDPAKTPVSEVMSEPLLTLEPGETVLDANKFMAKHKIRHLAVKENDKIIGVLSVRDLVHYFSNTRLREQ